MASTTSPAIIKWLQTSDGFLVRLISLEIISVVLLAILVLFGSYRRRSRSSALRYFLWTAYTLSGFLVSYTLGLMESANLRNEQFMVWAAFLLIVLGSSSNSISGYTMDDSAQWMMKMAQQLLQLIGVVFLANSYRQKYTFVLPLYILWFLCLMRLLDRVYAFGFASRFDEPIKIVASSINLERLLPGGGGTEGADSEADPISMRGYSYLLVEGEEKLRDPLFVGDRPSPSSEVTVFTDKVITIERIWRCAGGLLSPDEGDPDGQLKDMCLSFALFKQLQWRLAHYKIPVSYHVKTQKLIAQGLFSNYDRAYRVIEVELAFLYDFLYNKYSYTFIRASPLPFLVLSSATVIVSVWVAVVLIAAYPPNSGTDDQIHLEVLVKHGGITIDFIVSFLVVFTIMCLEIWQIVTFALSDWVKVRLLCKYVRTPSWQGNLYLEKVLSTLCRKRVLRPWSNTIGQYSLLESFNYQGWFPGLRKMINNCQPIYNWPITKGRKDKSPIILEKEVKMAVLQAIRDQIGLPRTRFDRENILSTGYRSWVRNGVGEQLRWVHNISALPIQQTFTWHVATSLCDIAFLRSNYSLEELPTQMRSNRLVAKSLSGYCAYLQVFIPQVLVMGKSYASISAFNKIVSEANIALGHCKTIQQMFDKLMMPEMLTEASFLWIGAKLGKQLLEEIQDESRRWKILADFWADYIWYLSSSVDSRGHEECLAEGGEFITHLWALLCHTGITPEAP